MSPDIRLVPIPRDVLRLLADWDLVEAGRRMGVSMPPSTLDMQWVWNAFDIRIAQAPEDEAWMTQYFAMEGARIVGDLRMHAPRTTTGWCPSDTRSSRSNGDEAWPSPPPDS